LLAQIARGRSWAASKQNASGSTRPRDDLVVGINADLAALHPVRLQSFPSTAPEAMDPVSAHNSCSF
jgi:hypothetical protein